VRRLVSAVVAAALMVGGVARAEGPPSPPPGQRPILRQGEPAPADGLLATDPWARYDDKRLAWVTAQREACLRQLEVSPPPGGWRPTLIVAGVTVTLGLAGGLYLGAKIWRR
jgi:hypothetical protein